MKKRSVFLSLLICIAAAFFACGIFAISNTKDKGQTVTAEAATAVTPIIYWRYTSSNTTLELSRQQLTGGTKNGSLDTSVSYNFPPWYGNNSNATRVNILTQMAPLSIKYWFLNCQNVVEINNLDYIDTSHCTDMSGLFANCFVLPSVDISNFDTSNVTDMSSMFQGMKAINQLDLSHFDTSNVTDMESMFINNSGLTDLNMSNLDTSNVTNMGYMFNRCSSLTNLDISGLNTSNVSDMSCMFCDCSSLTNLDVSGFNTSNVSNMSYMFEGCSSLPSVDVSNWDTSKVTDMSEMFKDCNLLEKLNLYSFNAGKVTNISDMLSGLTNLNKIRVTETLAKKIASLGDSALTFPLYYQDGTLCSSASQMQKGGGYFKTKHTHNYVLNSQQDATCGEAGEKISTCTEEFCEDVKTETIPANGSHTGGTATCVDKAVCEVCGEVYGELLPHTGGTASCTAKAVCEVCNEPYGSLAAHSPVIDQAVAATCTSTGLTAGSHCSECNTVITAQQPTPKIAHDWGNWHTTIPATEDTEGEEQRECQRADCSEVETRSIDMLEHTHKFAEGWSSDETNHWHASTCGHNVKDGEAAHTWNDGEITTPATCTVEGVKTFTCTICGKTRTETIDKIAHTPESVAAVDPDCTNTGLTEGSRCKVCGETLTAQNVVPALGHNYEAVEGGTPPTCTTAGSGKVVCSRCSDEKAGDSIPALGHNAGAAATCTEPQTCTVCGTELAAALGHTSEVDEAVAPTCTDTGLTAGTHCSVCGEIITAQEEVPALGHNYEWVITKEATVEETGLMENICTVCGDKDGEQEIAKLIDPNGEIDLPVDVHVEFKVTQSSTDNDYSDIEKGLKRGYWAQLWYRNDDGTLGDEFTDQINCFLTLKIPTDIIEAIRGGEEINRDKIAAGLKVYYIDGDGTPVEVDNFTIAMRDDDSWQIKFNYNEKFRAEVVFAADLAEQPTPEPEQAGIPWWVWLIVGLVVVAIVGVVIVIIVVAKKKGDGNNGGDTEELKARLAEQGEKIDELLGRDDGGFNTPVELDENGNVIFK